jgi:hypothetical protein
VLGWALWVLTLLGLAAAAWLDRLLRQAGRPELVLLGPSSISQVVAAVSAATVGAVLAARRPRHPVGWLLLGVGLGIGVHSLTFGYTRYGLVARPGALPAAGYLAGFDNGVVLSWIACAGLCCCSPPPAGCPRRAGAGGPGPPRPRPWCGCWRRWSTRHRSTRSTRPSGTRSPCRPSPRAGGHQPAAGVVVLASLVVGAVSLMGRFRRARGVERLQLRWLAWGAVALLH